MSCGQRDTCDPEAGTCCGAYGALCDLAACCDGFTCDATDFSCKVAIGAACGSGAACSDGAYCDDGTCGTTCTSYGTACSATIPCCNGLECDRGSQTCLVALGVECGARQCADGNICLPNYSDGVPSCAAAQCTATDGCSDVFHCCDSETCDLATGSCLQ